MEATAIATVTAKIERASATKAMTSVETALLKDNLPKTGKALKDTIAQSVSYELAKLNQSKRPPGILQNPKPTKRNKQTTHPNSKAAGTRPPAATHTGRTKSNPHRNNKDSSRTKSNNNQKRRHT
jgi:hypothetical protein